MAVVLEAIAPSLRRQGFFLEWFMIAVIRKIRWVAVVAGLGWLAACGEDGDSCASMVDTICAAACTCGGAAGCAVGDESGSLTFDNKQGCVAVYNLACSSEPPAGFSYSACKSALASPMCVASTDGMALKLPAACDQ